jgi:hypothetical protein
LFPSYFFLYIIHVRKPIDRLKPNLLACFNIGTGDVEDAPAPNALNTYEIIERDGAIYIRGEEAAIKSGQRSPNIRCSVAAPEKVVIVGGYVPPLFILQPEDRSSC